MQDLSGPCSGGLSVAGLCDIAVQHRPGRGRPSCRPGEDLCAELLSEGDGMNEDVLHS